MDEDTDLMTVPDAAKLKQVHLKSLYRAIREGNVKAEKRWGRVLIRRADLDAWQPSRRIQEARKRKETSE
jgi:excisionase family DNA binding protein